MSNCHRRGGDATFPGVADRQRNMDLAAMAASFLCLVHCLLLPLLAAFIPMIVGLGSLGQGFHILALATAGPLSLIALVASTRVHGRYMPLMIGTAGLMSLIAGAADALGAETAFSVAGACMLMAAHILNLRRDRHSFLPRSSS